MPIGQFLAPGLRCDVGLPLRDHRLGGITVLRNEIAGRAQRADVGDFPIGAGAKTDHSGDLTEMVLHMMAEL